jgi:excisionase family DNA binding protein
MNITTNQVNVPEAAELLGLNRATVVRWIRKGYFQKVIKFPGLRSPYILDRDEVLFHVGNKRTRIEKS